MDDEHTLPEGDARLRAALSPSDAVSHRIARRALEEAGPPHRQSELPSRRALAALALVALAIAVGIGAWISRRSAAVAVAVAPTLPLAITGRGATIVVEHPDGRRWIVGPPPERRIGGNYVIVLER